MNLRKTLPLLVIASMLLSMIPSMMVHAAVTASTSVAIGPVGTGTIISGTINAYNGHYSIAYDANDDGVAEVVLVASEVATGYSYSKSITIPESYFGARMIQVTDLDASGNPTATCFFTVETSYKVEANHSTNYEGGGVGATVNNLVLTTTIHGAPLAWSTLVRIRTSVTMPGGASASTGTTTALTQDVGFLGRYTLVYTITAPSTALTTWGTYSVLADTSIDAGVTFTNRASTTFSVGLTDATAYDRTVGVYVQVRAGATAIDKITVTDPNGVESADLLTTNIAINSFKPLPLLVLSTAKDSPLGVYTVKVYTGATVIKSSTFTVNKATLNILVSSFTQSSVKGITGTIAANPSVRRMQTVTLGFQVRYPTNVAVDNIDLTGVTVKASYNGTTVNTMTLGALTDYSAGIWSAAWKVPKDAKLGTDYQLYIAAGGITDAYGNVGPADMFNTTSASFTVTKGLFYPATPVLNYPASGNVIQRTLAAKALIDVRYADDSRYTSDDFSEFNGTIVGGAGYTFTSAATDYSADSGLWILKWTIPYNADIVAGTVYTFKVAADGINDKYGNGGNTATAATTGTFGTSAATIAVSNVTVNKEIAQSDEQVSVSYKAQYPSGADVTTKPTATYPIVSFDNTGINGAPVSKIASYNSATGLWTASWIIPSGSLSGTYNATILVNNVHDDATIPNTGPNVKKSVNFDVARVSLIDVLAASNAAKASSELALTKVEAAKVAADSALIGANAAKTSADAATVAAIAAGDKADAAKTSADAATAAANAAKASADAAKAAVEASGTSTGSINTKIDGLQTLVYGAIGASLIAAIAAIVALMQISRKIA